MHLKTFGDDGRCSAHRRESGVHILRHLKGTLPGSSGCSPGRWRAWLWLTSERWKVRLCPGLVTLWALSRRGCGQELETAAASVRADMMRGDWHPPPSERNFSWMTISDPLVLMIFRPRSLLPSLLALAAGAGCGEHRCRLSQSERGGAQRAATQCCYSEPDTRLPHHRHPLPASSWRPLKRKNVTETPE